MMQNYTIPLEQLSDRATKLRAGKYIGWGNHDSVVPYSELIHENELQPCKHTAKGGDDREKFLPLELPITRWNI